MKKKTKKQELVGRTHLLPLVFYLYGKRVKIRLNKKGTKFPILLVYSRDLNEIRTSQFSSD